MILKNISYNDKALKREVEKLVGPAFSWYERFKMNGIGSPKFKLIRANAAIEALLAVDNRRWQCHIELRPGGIILAFRSRLETYGWIVPYRNLSIFKNEGYLSLYSSQYFVKVVWESQSIAANKFLMKLLKLKSKVAEEEAMPDKPVQ
ncbi:MAG: hypothetical protein KJ578_11285 [Bacteroidetes bacterium]|nr:hypothetical protein [Bacteroidota bacterium]MBU1579106.1 hypothetical protein [Bacteroidota bacterium]MBU2558351.1 hypothetical protein [Bacteroidota bacterium]